MQSTMERPTRLLSVKEAADYLGVCPMSIYNWTAQGRLRCGRAGTRLKFRAEDLDAFAYGESRRKEN